MLVFPISIFNQDQSVSLVVQSCPTLWDPMDRSTPGLPVHHQHQLAQTHVYRVSDAIQPSHPLSSPSPPASIFPSIRVFSLMSQSFASSHQSIGVSSLASVLPMNTQDWFPLGWTGWTSLQSKGLSRVFSKTTVQKHQFFGTQLSSQSNSHLYMTTGKTIAFVGKVMSLLFNMLSRLVITFLPRSKRLLISWLQSPSAVILEPKKIKSATVSTVFPSICHTGEVIKPEKLINLTRRAMLCQ